jgi:PHD/YefM family antitoxin component YafN of YafNO toxin-antitoxin module
MSDHMQPQMQPKYQTLSIAAAQADLPRLCQEVAQHKGRLKIAADQGACALISQDELDGLEQALELLSDSAHVKALRDCLAHVAASVQPATIVA